jgi:Na+/proline symporter
VAVGAVYFGVCAAIAGWAAWRTRTAGDFFLAGRNVGIWTLSIAAMASTLSGFAFIGGPGLVYARGFGAVFIVLSAGMTSTLTAWVLAGRLRRLGTTRRIVSVAEAVGVRYRSRAAQRLAAVAMLVAVVGYVATNFLALGLILEAIFDLPRATAIVVGAAVVLAYSATGGMLAGMLTDLFQGLLMAVASSLVFVAVLASGGGIAQIARDIVAADPGWLGPWGHGTPLAALSFFFVFGLGTLGQPQVLHKFLMLGDPRKLRWYPLLMTGALTVTLLLFVGIGLAVKARVSTGDLAPLANPDDATGVFLLNYTPALLAGLVFSGAAAAIMSTVNAFLSIAAAACCRDLPARPVSPGRELAVGRLATVAVGLVGIGMALGSTTLVALLGVFGWGLFASTLVPALALGLVWPGATRAGAMASMGTGLVATLSLETLAWSRAMALPAGVSATGIAMVMSLVAFFAVSWLTREQAAGDLDADVRAIIER